MTVKNIEDNFELKSQQKANGNILSEIEHISKLDHKRHKSTTTGMYYIISYLRKKTCFIIFENGSLKHVEYILILI